MRGCGERAKGARACAAAIEERGGGDRLGAAGATRRHGGPPVYCVLRRVSLRTRLHGIECERRLARLRTMDVAASSTNQGPSPWTFSPPHRAPQRLPRRSAPRTPWSWMLTTKFETPCFCMTAQRPSRLKECTLFLEN